MHCMLHFQIVAIMCATASSLYSMLVQWLLAPKTAAAAVANTQKFYFCLSGPIDVPCPKSAHLHGHACGYIAFSAHLSMCPCRQSVSAENFRAGFYSKEFFSIDQCNIGMQNVLRPATPR